MESYFATWFENIRFEGSLNLLRSLTDPVITEQSKVTDLEIKIAKNLALEKLHS